MKEEKNGRTQTSRNWGEKEILFFFFCESSLPIFLLFYCLHILSTGFESLTIIFLLIFSSLPTGTLSLLFAAHTLCPN